MIDNGLELIGRFDIQEDVIRLAWSGSTIKADFYGDRIAVKLNSQHKRDYFVVKIDDTVVNEKLHIDRDGEYILGLHLELGKHTVELIKRTEFNIGYVEFKGFNVGNGYLIPREAPTDGLKLMFIGDSITCGFGSEGDETMEYDPQYDNAYLSYAMITSRTLDAKSHLISCSGYGIIRNYGGDMEHPIPTMVDKITPITTEMRDYTKFTPDVLIINLGTNDFSQNYIPNEEHFISAYKGLIDKLRGHYPNVKVLVTLGPLLNEPALDICRNYPLDIIHSYKDFVYFLEYPHQRPENGLGVSYHPSLKTHRLMSELLVQKLKEII